ncbi:MAG TPA: response regulator [Ignavibacteriaceae bacterium]|nr:response regulator [Ignavibacteriaceae bacterium]
METKSNTKILIVEDDELNIRMVSSFLRDKYDIDAARSGEEALKKAIDNKYDIFLMDIGLKKEMNGLEVTNRLRKMSEYKNVPIIALTAYALSGDRERILNAGCSHYLSKPFSKNQLLNLLEKIVNQQDSNEK